MKAAQTIPTRPGFTLVELLAVIGIIALLAALVAGGVAKVQNAQMQRNSEQTLVKLQMALDQQWKALADKVGSERSRNKIDNRLQDFCKTSPTVDGKEADRAAALYFYMLTRNELPQNFAEAVAAVPAAPAGFNGFSLPARTAFKNVSKVDLSQPVYIGGSVDAAGNLSGGRALVTSTNKGEVQAAVLLYLTLAEKSLEGTTFNADEATQSAQAELFFQKLPAFVTATDPSKVISFRVFTDAWGTPISFTRYSQDGFGFNAATPGSGELNNPPYQLSSTSKDPLDAKGLLQTSTWTNKTTAQTGIGATVYNGTGFVSITSANVATTPLFDNKNKQPSVFSAGPDRSWLDPSWSATNAVSVTQPDPNFFGGDNLAGYRLRREGARGD